MSWTSAPSILFHAARTVMRSVAARHLGARKEARPQRCRQPAPLEGDVELDQPLVDIVTALAGIPFLRESARLCPGAGGRWLACTSNGGCGACDAAGPAGPGWKAVRTRPCQLASRSSRQDPGVRGPEAAIALRLRPIRHGHGSERHEKRRLQDGPAQDRDGIGESGAGNRKQRSAGEACQSSRLSADGLSAYLAAGALSSPSALDDLTPCRKAIPFSVMAREIHAAASGCLIVVVVIGIRPASSGRERTGCPPTFPVANSFACPGSS